jgi:hypothetical protein
LAVPVKLFTGVKVTKLDPPLEYVPCPVTVTDPSPFTTQAGVTGVVGQDRTTESEFNVRPCAAESLVPAVFVNTSIDCGVFIGPDVVSGTTVGGGGGVTVGV